MRIQLDTIRGVRVPENLQQQLPVTVVIPDWGKAWTIYCLEYAVFLKSKGFEVSLIDLSLYNLNVKNPKRFLFRELILKKSNLFSISRTICHNNQIPFYRFTKVINISKASLLQKEREQVFEKAMTSKYANITGLRNTTIDLIDKKTVQIERKLFYSTLYQLEDLYSDANIQLVTVNGRYVIDSAVVQYARENSLPIFLLEGVSAFPNRFEIFEKSPHDLENSREKHLALWNNAGPDREIIAKKGLNRKISGNDSPGFNWRGDFEETAIIPSANDKRSAVYFPSSDREFSIFPEYVYQTSFSGDQHEAFRVFSRLARENDFEIIIRVHPVNKMAPLSIQNAYAKVEDDIWNTLGAESGALVIHAKSPISSYELMKHADLVVTYASSISIESLLLGKNTLVLGEFEFSYLFPDFCAHNELQIRNRLISNKPNFSVEALYPYGYWLERGGAALELFNFVSDDELYYQGKLINKLRAPFSKKVRENCTKQKKR